MTPVLALHCVGAVGFRPIGKSHFKPAPFVHDTTTDVYGPSDMSVQALKNSVLKHNEPVKYVDDQRCERLRSYLIARLQPFWFGDNFSSYTEAVAALNLSTAPGYLGLEYPPADDKGDCLKKFGNKVQELVMRLFQGHLDPLLFCLTLKDELRTLERVRAHKTRAFNASSIIHLIASKMLFMKQNEKLMKHLGKHPVTLGIQVPGPQFVTAILSLGQRAYEADGDGWDLRFCLSLARVIRDVRLHFLDRSFSDVVHHLYNSTYCGYTVAMGLVYWLLHNKSGWENTSTDNSLALWGSVWLAVTDLVPNREFDDVCKLLCNGDDLACSIDDESVGLARVRDHLAQWNIRLECPVSLPRPPSEITFLSHHLRERYVVGLGDIVIAAGNLEKLKSSIHWVKPTESLTFEESVIAHLLGLRLCLWPWPLEFDRIDEIIDSYLESIVVTASIRRLLQARLGEDVICRLHTKVEGGGFFFTPSSLSGDVSVSPWSLIKENLKDLNLIQ